MIPTARLKDEAAPFMEALIKSDWEFRVILFMSCLLCAGIGAAIFWVIETTSGSTLSFVGACNKFVVVILGGILFKAKITPIGWISVFFGVVAGLVFAVAKIAPRQKDGHRQETGQVTATVLEVGEDNEVDVSLLEADESERQLTENNI